MAILTSKLNGGRTTVVEGDPVWDTLDGRRARLSTVLPDGFLELMDDDCNPLPDLRHPSQVMALEAGELADRVSLEPAAEPRVLSTLVHLIGGELIDTRHSTDEGPLVARDSWLEAAWEDDWETTLKTVAVISDEAGRLVCVISYEDAGEDQPHCLVSYPTSGRVEHFKYVEHGDIYRAQRID